MSTTTVWFKDGSIETHYNVERMRVSTDELVLFTTQSPPVVIDHDLIKTFEVHPSYEALHD